MTVSWFTDVCLLWLMFETALPCGGRRLGGVETVWHGAKGGQTCVKRCSGESGAQTWPLTDSEPHSWGFIPLTLLKYTTVYYTELYFRGHMALCRLLRNTAWGSTSFLDILMWKEILKNYHNKCKKKIENWHCFTHQKMKTICKTA